MSRRTASRQGPAPPSTDAPKNSSSAGRDDRAGQQGGPEDHGGHQLAPRRHHQPGARRRRSGSGGRRGGRRPRSRRSPPAPAPEPGRRPSPSRARSARDEQHRERRHPGEEEVAHRVRRQHQPVGPDPHQGPEHVRRLGPGGRTVRGRQRRGPEGQDHAGGGQPPEQPPPAEEVHGQRAEDEADPGAGGLAGIESGQGPAPLVAGGTGRRRATPRPAGRWSPPRRSPDGRRPAAPPRWRSRRRPRARLHKTTATAMMSGRWRRSTRPPAGRAHRAPVTLDRAASSPSWASVRCRSARRAGATTPMVAASALASATTPTMTSRVGVTGSPNGAALSAGPVVGCASRCQAARSLAPIDRQLSATMEG